MILTVKGVQFSYESMRVLENMDLEVMDGEVVSLVGPNGSGKSTFLKCLNRILKPQRGAILVREKSIRELGLREVAQMLGYVPQSVSHAFPSTVFDTVLLGRRPHISWTVSARDKEIVTQTLMLMGLGEFSFRSFDELSGGEKQTVLIARAMAQEPEILLLDEPTSNLDLRHQLEVLTLICEVVRQKGISAIMAIHDLNLASRFSDRIIFLKEGKVWAAGKPSQVLTPENIRNVYGVDVIVNNEMPSPHVIPVGVSNK